MIVLLLINKSNLRTEQSLLDVDPVDAVMKVDEHITHSLNTPALFAL